MNESQYAGFWRRFAAYMIDSIVIVFALSLVQQYLSYTLQVIYRDWDVVLRMMNYTVGFLSLPLAWAYFSGMESSPLQATLGKLAVGIFVTDLQGQRVSFGRASGRFFGKILSAIILYIGFLMAGFTAKKQALHDLMSGCLVMTR
jgi:uncharacterized RDD family membrane protein YckC